MNNKKSDAQQLLFKLAVLRELFTSLYFLKSCYLGSNLEIATYLMNRTPHLDWFININDAPVEIASPKVFENTDITAYEKMSEVASGFSNLLPEYDLAVVEGSIEDSYDFCALLREYGCRVTVIPNFAETRNGSWVSGKRGRVFTNEKGFDTVGVFMDYPLTWMEPKIHSKVTVHENKTS